MSSVSSSPSQLLNFASSLTEYFDAVVMLTWSDWHSEPRSNRYHYAVRFAKCLPVLFVQPALQADMGLQVDDSGVVGIDIVNVSRHMDVEQARDIRQFLRARGIRRPLLWIYSSIHYATLLDELPNAFRVYHATEDYFTPAVWLSPNAEEITRPLRKLLSSVDLLVGVSELVVESYVRNGGYSNPTHLAPNGCDAGFFENLAPHHERANSNVAIFQGGINSRLNYVLLRETARLLSDWEFWFCGDAANAPQGWADLLQEHNVKYLGKLQPEEFGKRMWAATVGLIPFVEDELIWNSLPLKAYEYVACGLPVVTVPIAALEGEPRLFAFASTAHEFAVQIRRMAPSRFAPAEALYRQEVARQNSYDARFAEVVSSLAGVLLQRRLQTQKLNVAILYDDASNHVNTVREHLESFRKYSRHQIFYVPATDFEETPVNALVRDVGGHSVVESDSLSIFDIVVVHYCVRVSLKEHLNKSIAKACRHFSGLKVLFIQDEYDTPEIARSWMDDIGFDVVYTCVPPAEINKVYPRHRFPVTDFLPTLTGYVPESPAIDSFALPLARRKFAICYRGRKLPLIYGELGHEKYRIGVEAKRLAIERGIAVDIEVDDSKRIYGRDWYRFLGSARATLGTESGCNIFDFDGKIADAIKRVLETHPNAEYPEVRDQFLGVYDGLIRMNQISPKIFEAIRTRTALVLFEGDYSGVVQADVHFIPLRKDFSNFDEVMTKVMDDQFVEGMTARAYRDVIESGSFSYQSFVQGFDRDMDQKMRRGPRYEIFATPVFGIAGDGTAAVTMLQTPGAYLWGTGLLDRRSSKGIALNAVSQFLSQNSYRLPQRTGVFKDISLLNMLSVISPASARDLAKKWLRAASYRYGSPDGKKSTFGRVILRGWRVLPEKLKRKIRKLLRL